VEKIYDNVTELIGKTPLVRLHRVVPSGAAEVVAKFEAANPGGSIKDRIAIAMIDKAEREGCLKPGGTIVEPTSGNTGIGLAMVAAARGYRIILVMPETMSIERRKLLKLFGAEIVLSSGGEGMKGAVGTAEALCAEHPDYMMPQQFQNPANPEIHMKTTAQEILQDTAGRLDAFVAGIGTGGTITGVGKVIRETLPGVQIIGVEPEDSPILSGGSPGPHKIQGIGAGFVPGVLDTDIYNRIVTVSNGEAFCMMRRLAAEEGVLCGISSGAACAAAVKIAEEFGSEKRVVVLLPDTGERYLSLMEG
jgi:cysteine synthase A